MWLTPDSLTSYDRKNTLVKAVFEGKDISSKASITRNKTTKIATLHIDLQEKWALYAGYSVDEIDFSSPLLEGEGSGVYSLDVSKSKRSYFQLVTSGSKAILSERHLPMTGGFNFRDLGGYKTKDNRYVKWGKIFRSDELHLLTPADLKYLESIPLVSIVDFRSEDEMQRAPDINPSSVKVNYAYPITPGNLMAVVATGIEKLTAEDAESLMREMNVLLVTETASIVRYTAMFQLLQEDKDVPLMFHCSAGKDRTGMAAALILSALGVDEETILRDYMLSNTYLADKYVKFKAKVPALSSLFEVNAQFLQAGFGRIKQDHGSVENFLTEVLNVDIEKMREMYLY